MSTVDPDLSGESVLQILNSLLGLGKLGLLMQYTLVQCFLARF